MVKRVWAGAPVKIALAALLAAVLVAAWVAFRPSQTIGTENSTAFRVGPTLFRDSFDRTAAQGWGRNGEAEYQLEGAPDFSVSEGRGRVSLEKPGRARTATVAGLRTANVRSTIRLWAPTRPKGGSGVYVALQLRSEGGFLYRAVLRFTPDSEAYLSIARLDGGPDSRVELLAEQLVASRVKAGQAMTLGFSVTGSDRIRVAASLRQADGGRGREVVATDSSASRLLGDGLVTLWTYLSSSTQVKTTLDVDDFTVVEMIPDTSPGAAVGEAGPSSATPRASAPVTYSVSKARISGRQPLTAPDNAPAGAPPVGSSRYALPGDALYVSPTGDDDGAGTRDEPLGTVERAIERAEDGGTIVLRGGSYHESVMIPRAKALTLQPYPGEEVWFDGSSAVAGWRRSGSVWIVPWDHKFDASPTYVQGAPDNRRAGWSFVAKEHPMAAHPDQVWIDDEAQSEVGSRAQVRPGTFFVDSKRRELILGANPSGRQVRASDLAKAITVVGEGSVLRGFGVRRYATSVWQMGTVTVHSPGVRVENVVVSDNATTGLSVAAPGARLVRVTAVRNGMLGVHAHHADYLVASSVLTGWNNLEHFNRAPVAGGMKVTGSRHVRVRRSAMIDNLGHGLWFDASNYNFVVANSRLSGNDGAGLVGEISSTGLVIGNVIADNRRQGIWIINTDKVTIVNNTVSNNADRNIGIVMDKRRASDPRAPGHDSRRPRDPQMTWITRDIKVYNNRLAGGQGCVVCVEDYSKTYSAAQMGLSFDHNYYQPLRTRGPFALWPRRGMLSSQLPTFGAYRTGTGQDRSSRTAGAGSTAVPKTISEAVARSLSWEIAGQADQRAGIRHLGAFGG